MPERVLDQAAARGEAAVRGSSGAMARSVADAVLALQLAAGNRATMTALGRTPKRVMQRVLTFQPSELVGVRSQEKGKTSFDGIWMLLVQYYETNLVETRYELLKKLQKAINKWMEDHDGETKNDPRPAKLVDLQKAVGAELATAAAEAEYVEDLRRTYADRKKDIYNTGFQFASTFIGEGIDDTDLVLTNGPPDRLRLRAPYGGGPEAHKIMNDRALTDAEMLAIKVYTTGDYHTINPTLQGDDAWLEKKLPEVAGAIRVDGKPKVSPQEPKEPAKPPPGARPADQAAYQKALGQYNAAVAAYPTSRDKVAWDAAVAKLQGDPVAIAQIKKDALRHAGLVNQALSKLEPHTGKVFRGERKTRADFKTGYQDKHKQVMDRRKDFTSTSTDRPEAIKFAKGNNPKDGKQGVLVELECKGLLARDIHSLSHHGNELEVLLLPGAGIKIDKIHPPDLTKDPTLSGVDWVVEAHEVK